MTILIEDLKEELKEILRNTQDKDAETGKAEGQHRPIVFFDFETSGVRTDACRVVQMSFIKYSLDSTDKLRKENLTVLVNPKIKMETGASKINGIYDEDVVNSDTFADHWDTARSFLQGAIAVGYNSNDFDKSVLKSEIIRNGLQWDSGGTIWIDTMKIFREAYGLRSGKLFQCHKFYTGVEHTGAHDAEDDVYAVVNIFIKQFQLHKETPFYIDRQSRSPHNSYDFFELEKVWLFSKKKLEYVYFNGSPLEFTTAEKFQNKDTKPESTPKKSKGGKEFKFANWMDPLPQQPGLPKDYKLKIGKDEYRKNMSESTSNAFLAENIIWACFDRVIIDDVPDDCRKFILENLAKHLARTSKKHLAKIGEQLKKGWIVNSKLSKLKNEWFYINVIHKLKLEKEPVLNDWLSWASNNRLIIILLDKNKAPSPTQELHA